MTIEHIQSRQILDSRGQPTLETTVILDTGDIGRASVPSGASTGSHEAVELRDGAGGEYDGASVHQAIANVTGPIAKALRGVDIRLQQDIDDRLLALDGTLNKSKLGANAILSVSLATVRAHAAMRKSPVWKVIREILDSDQVLEVPKPMMNIINGGRHATNGLAFQEFLILPQARTGAERVEQGVRVYHHLQKLLTERGHSTHVGDEGGFAPKLRDERQALEYIVEAVERSGYQPGKDIFLGLDCAASEFYDAATKRYRLAPDREVSSAEMIELLRELSTIFPLQTIEDPLAEDDWDGWISATKALTGLTLIGDDLFVTSRARLEEGIKRQAANAVLIKPNQVGTLSETLDTIRRAGKAHWPVIASHRSGETGDDTIVDLAWGVGARYLKAGAPARGERVAKYNRYLDISATEHA